MFIVSGFHLSYGPALEKKKNNNSNSNSNSNNNNNNNIQKSTAVEFISKQIFAVELHQESQGNTFLLWFAFATHRQGAFSILYCRPSLLFEDVHLNYIQSGTNKNSSYKYAYNCTSRGGISPQLPIYKTTYRGFNSIYNQRARAHFVVVDGWNLATYLVVCENKDNLILLRCFDLWTPPSKIVWKQGQIVCKKKM